MSRSAFLANLRPLRQGLWLLLLAFTFVLPAFGQIEIPSETATNTQLTAFIGDVGGGGTNPPDPVPPPVYSAR